MMKSFGVPVQKQENNGEIAYLFSGEGSYQALDYDIEPDMSAAAYFYTLAAVLGIQITVKGVTGEMLQGDVEFLKVLEKMGCEVFVNADGGISAKGTKKLKGGFSVDMSAFSDQALTLAAIAPYADKPITITGIGHIRLQECDRIKAIVENLTALGIRTDEKEDQVIIYPGVMKGCEIETFEDHRVAMSFALTGLRTEGVVIKNPGCCKKTFAEYFEVLEKVLEQVEG